MDEIILKLKQCCEECIGSGLCEHTEVADLVAAASEVVGVLKTLDGFNLKQMSYDMARLAACAGSWPDNMGDTEQTST